MGTAVIWELSVLDMSVEIATKRKQPEDSLKTIPYPQLKKKNIGDIVIPPKDSQAISPSFPRP